MALPLSLTAHLGKLKPQGKEHCLAEKGKLMPCSWLRSLSMEAGSGQPSFLPWPRARRA
jgi:hypothetical protein